MKQTQNPLQSYARNLRLSRRGRVALATILTVIFFFPPFGGTKGGCQNIAINTTGAAANATAILDVSATNLGLLIPRMTLCQRTTPSCAGGLLDAAGNFLSGVAAQGLLVYQTDGTQGFYYNTSITITPTWAYLSSGGGSGWLLLGNAGTVDGTNFIGTTDNIPFNIRVNNQKAGRVRYDVGFVAGEVFLGYQAGNSNTDPRNVGIGFRALYNNTTAYQNTAIGWNALYSNTTGNNNTASGTRALYSNTTGGDNTAIGLTALYSNTIGLSNTANGLQALYNNTTGGSNTALGEDAGYGAFGVSFTECTFVGGNSYPTVARSNVTMLGYGIANAQCTGNNQVCVGNTAIAAGGLRAQVTGWTAYSDARFKTNVKENVTGLDFILRLKPVTYNVKPTELHKIWGTPDSLVSKIDHSEAEKETRIGFVAQDVEKAAKESGFNFPGLDVPRNEKEVYTLRYVDFIMPMVKAMQELHTENDSLKLQVAGCRLQVAGLKLENQTLNTQYSILNTQYSILNTQYSLQQKEIEKIKQNMNSEVKK